jgi:hypothetical protein
MFYVRRTLVIGIGFLMAYLLACGTLLKGKVYVSIGTAPPIGQNIFAIEPCYRSPAASAARLLEPAHRLDRIIRSDYWRTIENSNGQKWKNPSS